MVVPGQILLAPNAPFTQGVAKQFELLDAGSPDLGCKFYWKSPRLSFTLQYWTGYNIDIPIRDLAPNPEKGFLNILVRVAPQNGQTRYLALRTPIPPIPSHPNERKSSLIFSAGFAVGTGKYEITAMAITDKNQFCTKTWKVSAPKFSNLRIDPGTVSDSIPKWERLPSSRPPKRLTIFLNAAPLVLRRHTVHLSFWDQTALVGSITSILDHTEFTHARVVAYNFETQQVLLDEQQFNSQAHDTLIEQLKNMNLGVISLEQLESQNPTQFLTELLRKELSQQEQADTIIFLGPITPHDLPLTPELKELSSKLPPTLGIFFPSQILMPYDDLVVKLVSEAKGKKFRIYSPAPLNQVIQLLNKKSD